jgi:hypothetical protein
MELKRFLNEERERKKITGTIKSECLWSGLSMAVTTRYSMAVRY